MSEKELTQEMIDKMYEKSVEDVKNGEEISVGMNIGMGMGRGRNMVR